jgi:hypothetical protein
MGNTVEKNPLDTEAKEKKQVFKKELEIEVEDSNDNTNPHLQENRSDYSSSNINKHSKYMDLNMQNNAYYNVRQKSAKNQMISPNNYTKKTSNFEPSKSPLRDRKSNNEEVKANEDSMVMDTGANTPTYANNRKETNQWSFKSPHSNIKDVLGKRESSPFENLLRKSANIDYKSIGNVSTNDRSRSSYKNKTEDSNTPKSEFEKSNKSDVSTADLSKQESNTPKSQFKMKHPSTLVQAERPAVVTNIRQSYQKNSSNDSN